MAETPQEGIEELPIAAAGEVPEAVSQSALGEQSIYLIYNTENTYKRVEAESVTKAIKLSGIEAPHHIVRDGMFNKVVLDADFFG